MISVEVISNGGFTKEVYRFKCEGETLKYTFYSFYHRSHLDEPWGDEWPEPDEKAWSEKYGDTFHCSEDEDRAWNRYCDRFNPVRSIIIGGTGKYARAGGMAGYNLAKCHLLPEGVKEKAKILFIENLTVE